MLTTSLHPRFSGLSLKVDDKKKQHTVTLVAADCDEKIANYLEKTSTLKAVKISDAVDNAGIMAGQIKINNRHLGASQVIAILSSLLKEALSFEDFFNQLPEERLRQSLKNSFEKKNEIPVIIATAQTGDVKGFKDSKNRFKETVEKGNLTTGETEEGTRFIRFTLDV